MTRAVLYVLLGIVAITAAVLSFAALDELGTLCGFGTLSPLLPVVLDAEAAAGTVAWLARVGRPREFGRVLALVLLGGSVAGNAASHALTAYATVPPWQAVVVVSAVPPAVLGAVVHLATLAAQARTAGAEQVGDRLAEAPHDEELTAARMEVAEEEGRLVDVADTCSVEMLLALVRTMPEAVLRKTAVQVIKSVAEPAI